MSYFLQALKKYATFSGRARRKEYWMYTLFYALIILAVEIISWLVIGISALNENEGAMIGSMLVICLFVGIVSLGLLVPTLAVTVRRLHDTGRSGFWYFISFIPFIGGIWLLVLLCLDGQPGPNEYGENPKEIA